MSFVPAFEIGIWNAWILITPYIVYWFVGVKFLFAPRMPKNPAVKNRKMDFISNILFITMIGSFIYSIFIQLKLGIVWFYLGLLIYLTGLILITISIINFAATPIDKPVTKGVYRYSRNPMFIGFFVVYFGVTIACISWVYLIIIVFFILSINYLSPFEEAITLRHYGKEYKEYMKRTPKWIGLLK